MKSLSVFLMCLTVSGTFMTVHAFGAETECKNIVQVQDAKPLKGAAAVPATVTKATTKTTAD